MRIVKWRDSLWRVTADSLIALSDCTRQPLPPLDELTVICELAPGDLLWETAPPPDLETVTRKSRESRIPRSAASARRARLVLSPWERLSPAQKAAVLYIRDSGFTVKIPKRTLTALQKRGFLDANGEPAFNSAQWQSCPQQPEIPLDTVELRA